ncbi:MAG: hypothetical protein GY698_03660 [Actinomycetia bacterium]|nr:hypothetical protein [Actinomycetes bacterium]
MDQDAIDGARHYPGEVYPSDVQPRFAPGRGEGGGRSAKPRIEYVVESISEVG